MPTLSVNINKQIFTSGSSIGLKLSGSINNVPNGLSFNTNGTLKATKGAKGSNGTGTLQNTAGNGIDNGNVNDPSKKISKIRCNTTVTRKNSNDPDSSNKGISIYNIAKYCGVTL